MTTDISSYWPFDALPEISRKLLSDAAISRELPAGASLFEQGDIANALYVLVEGELDLYQGDPPRWRKRFGAGVCIGELPLVVGGQRVRSASLRAVGPARLLELGYSDVRRLLTRRVFDSLLTPVTERHLAKLESGLVSLFGELPLALLVEIESAMIQLHLPAGELLFERGDSLEHVWLVDEGRLEVLIERGGKQLRVAELGPGQPVGELAVLVGGERSATVRALRDSWLRGLTASTFEALLMRHPGAAVGLARTLARRLVRANQQPVVIDQPRTLALIPADDAVDLARFGADLVAALSEPHEASATVLDHEQFTADAPTSAALDDESAARRFGEWLTEAETEHEVVLLLLHRELDSWSAACLRAADEAVLVASHDADVGLSPIERGLANSELDGAISSLVLCHPVGAVIDERVDTIEPWCEHRPKLIHLHQITLADRRDFARLGRGLFRW